MQLDEGDLCVPLDWILNHFPKGRLFSSTFTHGQIVEALTEDVRVDYRPDTQCVRPRIPIPKDSEL
ncbi:hypothetical protein KIPB_016825, partial [Kipferlia bialata]|eukprot:g16825.t1